MQVATYHYEIKPLHAIAEAGSMHVSGIGKKTDWKMYLVQELCNASLADILVVGMLHDKETRRPFLVIFCFIF
jgi:hypothetical protein